MTPTPHQTRAARNWLGWTQRQLAKKAQVGLSTIRDYERGRRTPVFHNQLAIKEALEIGGIEFAGEHTIRLGMARE